MQGNCISFTCCLKQGCFVCTYNADLIGDFIGACCFNKALKSSEWALVLQASSLCVINLYCCSSATEPRSLLSN